MDAIRFDIAIVPDPVGGTHEVVEVLVNGRSLNERAGEVEIPYAMEEVAPPIAGKYAGLLPEIVLPPSRHFLGEPARRYRSVGGGEGKTAVLQCTCLEAGCWPLVARIAIGEDTVIWSDFEQPHRSRESVPVRWYYDRLGPFVFSKAQYEAALVRVSQPDMKYRRYYALWYRLDAKDGYIHYYSNGKDGVLVDYRRNVPAFPSLDQIRVDAQRLGIYLQPEEPFLYDFDAIGKWIERPWETEVDCDALLAAWNLFGNIASST